MASDRGKWSNYVHSCISGTHGTHTVVPGRAPSSDRPSEKWNRTFAYHLKWYKFCLIGLLWVFRSRYLLKISNVIKRKNGSFEKLHWTSANAPDFIWRGWSRDFFGFEIFDSGIFLVRKILIYAAIFLCIQNNLTLSLCMMLLMKQKMFLGVSSVDGEKAFIDILHGIFSAWGVNFCAGIFC